MIYEPGYQDGYDHAKREHEGIKEPVPTRKRNFHAFNRAVLAGYLKFKAELAEGDHNDQTD